MRSLMKQATFLALPGVTWIEPSSSGAGSTVEIGQFESVTQTRKPIRLCRSFGPA